MCGIIYATTTTMINTILKFNQDLFQNMTNNIWKIFIDQFPILKLEVVYVVGKRIMNKIDDGVKSYGPEIEMMIKVALPKVLDNF